jgi:RNA polymerase sigma-70 factor, ECF subfamily
MLVGRAVGTELMAAPTDPDEALIARAQVDATAFGALYERYLTVIYNYVYYRLHNVHEAEDLTAKVFYQALTHLDRYTSQGVPFGAWLFRIAHNLVANWYRDSQRRRTYSLDAAQWEPAGPGPELEGRAVAKEEERELRSVLAKLSPDRQHLIVLKYVEGLSNAEIGTIMGRTEGAVKALLHRTLLALRGELGSRQAPETDWHAAGGPAPCPEDSADGE